MNGLDLSCIEGEVVIEGEISKVVLKFVLKVYDRFRIVRRLDMLLILDVVGNEKFIGDISSIILSDMLKISFSSGVKIRFFIKNLSNLKEIRDDSDLDIFEKILMVKKREKFVINDINEVCERYRE